jgi:hypothetical protein
MFSNQARRRSQPAWKVKSTMNLYIESRIAGAFKGWTGRGTYKLANGQYWRQTAYKYQYKYKYRPSARIWKDGSRYYLEVDGMPSMVPVRRTTAPELDQE